MGTLFKPDQKSFEILSSLQIPTTQKSTSWNSPLSLSSPSSPSSPRVWLLAVRLIVTLYYSENHTHNIHIQAEGPMYVHVTIWPWNILTRLLFSSYIAAHTMWVLDNELSTEIILKRFSGAGGLTCCGPLVNGVGKWVNLAKKFATHSKN